MQLDEGLGSNCWGCKIPGRVGTLERDSAALLAEIRSSQDWITTHLRTMSAEVVRLTQLVVELNQSVAALRAELKQRRPRKATRR